MNHLHSFRRILLGVVALAIGLATTSFLADGVSAGFTTCRTDPIVTLSNGKQITLWADIQTDISNVTSVNYSLHIPGNLRVTSVSYDQYASIEHFSWTADRDGGEYAVNVNVQTLSLAANTPFTAWATVGSNNYSASSSSGQGVSVQWRT